MGALTFARTPTRSRRRPSARPLALALALAATGCTDPPADPMTATSTPAASQSPVVPVPSPSPSPGSILDNLEAGPPDALPLPFPTAALAEVADGEVDPVVRAEIQAEHDAFQERGGNRGADVLTVIRAEEGT